MKKLTQKLFIGLLASAALFSCGGDEDTLAGPTVTVTATVNGNAITSGDNVEVGSVVTFNVSISAPAGVNGLDVNGTSYSRAQLQAEAGDTQASITITSEITSLLLGGTTVYEFEAVDDAGQTSAVVSFEIVASSPAVVTQTETLIGGQLNSTTGSFYNSIGNEVYTYTDMRDNNSGNTDFLFFYGGTSGNLYTIASLDDADAITAFESAVGANALDASVIQFIRETRFKTVTTTSAEFDAIATDSDLESAYGEIAASATQMITLETGDVFGFALDAARGGYIGLAKVVSTSGDSGSNRAITIQVKIESAASTN